MTANVRAFSGFVLALAGPIVWAAHFFIVYGLEAVVCARASSPVFTMRWIMAISTGAAVAGLATFLTRRLLKWRNEPEASGFLHEISVYLALISIGAILAIGAIALHLPACLQPTG